MTRFISYVLVFILGFGACATIYYTMPPHGSGAEGGMNRSVASTVQAPATASADSTSAAPTASAPPTGPGSTIESVAIVEPSVVNIDITGKPLAGPSEGDNPEMPFGPPGMPQGQPVPKGQASGVIISADGYILTNNHVAGEASTMHVTLHDGRRFSARVVGLDPESDLAVIKIDAKNLPAAHIGNSTNVKVGQWVIAVGNPLGIGATATAGIISAIRSPFPLKGHVFPEIIQTDAAINPGNSGGALADLNGNIIGINTAIASTTGGNIGIAFSIPINMAFKHAQELIKTKSVTYPWLGVAYRPQQPDRPLPVSGVLVDKVIQGSPADRAGIQAGDILTEINKRPIDEPEKINFLVTQHQPGESITISTWRNGQARTQTVVLAKRPGSRTGAPQQQAPQQQAPQQQAPQQVQPDQQPDQPQPDFGGQPAQQPAQP